MTPADPPRVLLVSPPWRTPYGGSLALATLRPILEQAGIVADELHGTPLYPVTISSVSLLEHMCGYVFAPHVYPEMDIGALVDTMVETQRVDSNRDGLLLPDEEATCARLGIDEGELRKDILQNIEWAGICIDRCVERAAQPRYDIVGFSCTFEAQVPAALAIARRLKAARPDVRIILGGAACFEIQGDGMARSFGVLDAVCHAEGDDVIVPLVRALRGDGALEDVPGIAWVDGGGALHHNPSPPLLVALDSLPYPDYGPFIEQWLASEWSHHYRPKLFFETSRGCWWGQKHLCTFCGLNAEGLTFRAKSPDRAYDEIRRLYLDYPEAPYLQATDNILATSYFKDVLPRLAQLDAGDPARPLNMFFEIKSNLRKDQVQAMADAGIVDVQPGIESFSDGVLQLMDKGATGIGQVQFIKWAFESGIDLIYNLIIRNPGERAEWYRTMTELIGFIGHLPAPVGITPMLLERFSPYHTNPERYGMSNVRPKAYYSALYPDPAVDLEHIAYVFDYDHPILEDADLIDAHRTFVGRIIEWQNSWRQRQAFYLECGAEGLAIGDRRQQGEIARRVTGMAARVFRYLDKARPRAAIARRFSSLDEDTITSLLAAWLHHRWVCTDGRRVLAVVPGQGRPAVTGDSPAMVGAQRA